MMGAPIFLPGLFTFHLKEGVNNFERWFWLVTVNSLFSNKTKIALPVDTPVMGGLPTMITMTMLHNELNITHS